VQKIYKINVYAQRCIEVTRILPATPTLPYYTLECIIILIFYLICISLFLLWYNNIIILAE